MLLLPAATAARRRRASTVTAARSWVADHAPSAVGAAQLTMLVAFCFAALGGVLAKMSYAAGATPVSFLSIRLVAAVAILAVLTRRSLFAVPRAKMVQLFVLGVFFGAQTLAYYVAIANAPIGLVVVVVSAYPVVILLSDAVAERTMPSPRAMTAMTVALVGLWLAAGRPVGTPNLGVTMALVSAFGYATYLRLSAPVQTGVRPMVSTAWVMAGAAALMLVLTAVMQPAFPSVDGVAVAVVHGGVSTALPIAAVYAALRTLTTNQIASLGPLEPIIATGFATVLLGESLGPFQVIGAVVVVGAVATLSGVRPRVGLPRLPFAVPRMGRPVR